MIIFDTETTAFVAPSVTELEKQTRMIEFAAIKIDDVTLEEKERLTFLLNPGIPLSDDVKKTTKLSDDDLKNEKKFIAYYLPLANFFLGERALVAHNANFDVLVIDAELRRLGKERNFPWPFRHICTVEETMDMAGKRLKLIDLYRLLFATDPVQTTHRAMNDVEILYACFKELKRQGRIV
jgi:DNA polymerase-3 subunit alpha (Gram-positive type)